MRIAYLGQMADVATENGIAKKIAAQARRWRQAGHAVRYFSLVPTATAWSGFDVEHALLTRGNVAQRVARSFRLADRIRAWRPDAIYFRYAYHSAGLPALFREIPTVAEINSDDLTEYPLTLGRAKVLYHRLTRTRVLRAVAGFVPVTHELAGRFAAFGRPAEVIANGIDLDAFTVAPPPDGSPHLIFLGSAGSPWHGVERMIELAHLLPEVTIDVVGRADSELGATLVPPNLKFHGVLPRERYEPLLRAATAALGTLALFKNRMEEACPLKVREYLAAGLPVIAGYRDTDVPAGAGYFLSLPNDVAPLAARRGEIVAWLDRWRGRRVARTEIAHLDNGVKEQRRLAFLARFVR